MSLYTRVRSWMDFCASDEADRTSLDPLVRGDRRVSSGEGGIEYSMRDLILTFQCALQMESLIFKVSFQERPVTSSAQGKAKAQGTGIRRCMVFL